MVVGKVNAPLMIAFLRWYHSYEAIGVENVPRTGPCFVIGTHSLATYENFLLFDEGERKLGRRGYITADSKLFRAPFAKPLIKRFNLIESNREIAIELLKAGNLIAGGPGGMREALRNSKNRYQIDWQGRHGFVWTSILAASPIVLAACPRADDIYTVYDSSLSKLSYEKFHFPLPLFRGVGPTPIPRRVKLTHLLSEAINPPCEPEKATKEIVTQHFEYLVERMNGLIEDALKLG
jgi:1-acyl-sn-glycerol-3-phosphate acyltransferase